MRRVALSGAALLACVALAGCGTSAPERADADGGVVLLVDCSRSTAPFRAEWLGQIRRRAAEALDDGHRVSAACVEGDPAASIRYIQLDAEVPEQYSSNPVLVERYHAGGAAVLARDLGRRMMHHPARKGSPLLEALEVSGDLHPRAIVLWTDGLLIDPAAGIDVNRGVTAAQRAALLRTWPPRLRALRGVPVTVYGLGGDARSSAIVRRARSLLDEVTAASGVPVTWSRDAI